MNISELVSTDYAEVSPDTRVAKVVSIFDDPACRGVVVTDEGSFEGVITRRQLVGSQYDPDRTAETVTWAVPRVGPTEDVREVARLMIDGDARLLPVFDSGTLTGVVTADRLLEAVEAHLSAADVNDAYTADLRTIEPETTLGEALNRFQEEHITHLPVVAEGDARGMLTLYDVVDLTVRETDVQQGGATPGFDGHGGQGSSDGFRSHGGRGAREGELTRLLDLPVRDEMTRPVHTVDRDATLETAVRRMFDAEASSLLVTDAEDRPAGILTKTDALDALTWGTEGHRAVQVYGTEYIDDVSYEDIVAMVDDLDRMDGSLDLFDVRFHVTRHQERQRGNPLLHVRGRLSTDRGLITASAEGYGASHAFNEVENRLKRRIRDGTETNRNKKHPDEEFWDKRFGWLLAE
ncbi:MAG: CBS domain-containing protein [Haloglomus sp.]